MKEDARSTSERTPQREPSYRVAGLLHDLLPIGAEGVEAVAADAEEPVWRDEEAMLSSAVPKRQREVAAGRACARRALRRLGAPAVPLPADGDRVPRWPEEVRGTITHTENYAAAAVAWARSYRGLGVDAERVTRVRSDFVHLIARPEELDWLSAQLEPVSNRARALLFSAKEAAYKCQFPLTRRRCDFLDARCELLDQDLQARGRFRVSFDRAAGQAEPLVITGRYAFGDDLVVCVADWPTFGQAT